MWKKVASQKKGEMEILPPVSERSPNTGGKKGRKNYAFRGLHQKTSVKNVKKGRERKNRERKKISANKV